MSKENLLFSTLLGSLNGRELDRDQWTVLLVHSIMVANGLVPTAISSGRDAHICLLPSTRWPEGAGDQGVFAFKYCGDMEVKCVSLPDNRLVVHFSDGRSLASLDLRTDMSGTEIINLVKSNLVARISIPPTPVTSERRPSFAVPYQPSSQQPERGFSPPRAPPFGVPVGPGELVGPNHPIFTGETDPSQRQRGGLRDPRFDPLGPGHIGEPNNDEFMPPPFGAPPGVPRPPRRAPLRGPGANLGPGGMFM